MIDKIETIAFICFVIFLFLLVAGAAWNFDKISDSGTDNFIADGEIFSVNRIIRKDFNGYSVILVHNDTGVLYFYNANSQRECITPLFNPDGTLCTIEGELNENG